MNTNIGEMPLEIYLDYISEITDQEWVIEYLFHGHLSPYSHVFCMVSNRFNHYTKGNGFGDDYHNTNNCGKGNAINQNWIDSHHFGNGDFYHSAHFNYNNTQALGEGIKNQVEEVQIMGVI